MRLSRLAGGALLAAALPLAGQLATSPASGAADDDAAVEPCADADAAAVAGMSVVEAAATVPELAPFAAAIEGAGLAADIAAGGGPYTVFAPSRAALDAIPENAFRALLADVELLQMLVAYHIVLGAAMDVDELVDAGTLETMVGPLTVTVGDGVPHVNGAPIVCGPIDVADATVYVIGSVLQPPTDFVIGCPPGSSLPGSSVPGYTAPVTSVPSTSVPASSVPC